MADPAYFRLIKTGQLRARAHNCPVLMNLKYGVKKIVQGTSYEVSRVNLSRGQIYNQSCPGGGGGGGGGVQRTVQRVVCSHPRWLLSPSVDAYKYLCLGLPVHCPFDQPWGLLWCYFLCDKHRDT